MCNSSKFYPIMTILNHFMVDNRGILNCRVVYIPYLKLIVLSDRNDCVLSVDVDRDRHAKSWKIDQSRSVDLFPQLLQGYAIDEMCANRCQYIPKLKNVVGVGQPVLGLIRRHDQ